MLSTLSKFRSCEAYTRHRILESPWNNINLIHWGRVTHICVGNLTIIGSDNGLSPGRRQAIIWTNDGILLLGPLGTKFNEIVLGIQIFSFKKVNLKLSSAKWRPFCLGLNKLISIRSVLCNTILWNTNHDTVFFVHGGTFQSTGCKMEAALFEWFWQQWSIKFSQ